MLLKDNFWASRQYGNVLGSSLGNKISENKVKKKKSPKNVDDQKNKNYVLVNFNSDLQFL